MEQMEAEAKKGAEDWPGRPQRLAVYVLDLLADREALERRVEELQESLAEVTAESARKLDGWEIEWH